MQRTSDFFNTTKLCGHWTQVLDLFCLPTNRGQFYVANGQIFQFCIFYSEIKVAFYTNPVPILFWCPNIRCHFTLLTSRPALYISAFHDCYMLVGSLCFVKHVTDSQPKDLPLKLSLTHTEFLVCSAVLIFIVKPLLK